MSDLKTVPRSEEIVAHPRSGRRKAKALLAGGLVLGIGAAITLAAWNDSEYAGGGFSSGTFDLEGSIDGQAWGDHPAPDNTAAQLNFELDTYRLTPNEVMYAPFAVRLDATTNYNADVTISGRAVQIVDGDPPLVQIPSVPNFTYEMIQTETFEDCAPDTTGTTTLVQAGTPLGTVPGPGPVGFELSHGPMDANGQVTGPGAQVNVCIKVTAGPLLPQGQNNGAGWQFLATSKT